MPDSYWVKPDFKLLRNYMRNHLHGQHLVLNVVNRALKSHLLDPSPRKALVMSLHGDTGTGKNFVADIIAHSLFKLADKSSFVHKFIATKDFPHLTKTDIYKLDIQDKIRAAVASCERSLFIFDEVHRMPPGLIDSIKPFIDFHDNINGVDFRKSVFIFLSNTGTKAILQAVLDRWMEGKKREEITMKDLEPLVQNGAFNENGGLHMSEVIQHSLVDFYVPFMPMERRHIRLCTEDDIRARGKVVDEEVVEKVADDMNYFPSSHPLFATKGCKNVHQKVGFHIIDVFSDTEL